MPQKQILEHILEITFTFFDTLCHYKIFLIFGLKLVFNPCMELLDLGDKMSYETILLFGSSPWYTQPPVIQPFSPSVIRT